MENSKISEENLSYLIVIGFIIVVGVLGAIFWLQSIQSNNVTGDITRSLDPDGEDRQAAFSRARLTPTPTLDPVEATAQAGRQEVTAAINQGGCIACHTIPGIPNAVGQVGPNLSQIGVEAATRQDGVSADAYLRESMLDPNAFIAPNCPTGECPSGVMPAVTLGTAEINVIVAYLSTLGVE